MPLRLYAFVPALLAAAGGVLAACGSTESTTETTPASATPPPAEESVETAPDVARADRLNMLVATATNHGHEPSEAEQQAAVVNQLTTDEAAAFASRLDIESFTIAPDDALTGDFSLSILTSTNGEGSFFATGPGGPSPIAGDSVVILTSVNTDWFVTTVVSWEDIAAEPVPGIPAA